MPTYDYLCPNGHRFEVIHSVTGDGPETCPVCGAAPLRKAFTAPTIHFKGSGWAKKDRSSASRSHKPAASADGESGPNTSAAGSDDGKRSGSAPSADAPDAKPAADAKPASSSTSSGSPGGSPKAAD